jgi:hypothetical protein
VKRAGRLFPGSVPELDSAEFSSTTELFARPRRPAGLKRRGLEGPRKLGNAAMPVTFLPWSATRLVVLAPARPALIPCSLRAQGFVAHGTDGDIVQARKCALD